MHRTGHQLLIKEEKKVIELGVKNAHARIQIGIRAHGDNLIR